MDTEMLLKRAVGKADMCELLAKMFSYPDESLASALADGSLTDDCVACLEDAGCASFEVSAVHASLADSEGETLSEMRKEYTRLYLSPVNVLVYPYESAFFHVEAGAAGKPILFRTPITLDVAHCMREAGVAPKNAQKEPCDSIFSEFSFLSYLYGNAAAAMQREDGDGEMQWCARTNGFLESHALRWMPSFMTKTTELSGGVYRSFAQAALAFLDVLRSEAASDGGVVR